MEIMDIKFIETSLATSNLKDYLIEQINTGNSEAEKEAEDLINKIIKKIEIDSLNEEFKSAILAVELISLQKIIYQKEISLIAFYIKNFKGYKTSFFNTKNESSEEEKLAAFIIEYYNFINKPDIFIVNELRRIKEEFSKYFLFNFFEKKSERLFEKLNELNYLEKFNWSFLTFESGILEILKKIYFQNKENEHKSKQELDFLKTRNEIECDKLRFQIDSYKSEIKILKGVIQYNDDYRKKYLDDVQVKVYNTFFGDNLPFLVNLYNFLCEHLLLKMCSFSHFYLCMTVNNNEIINLNNEGNSRFVGRIFYHLSKLSTLKTKKLFEEYIRNKFYVNEKPIVSSFFTNNVFVTIDTEIYTSVLKADTFFEKQREIFIS